MGERFTIRAVKRTEHLLQTSIIKDGITEPDIRLGIGIDMGSGEIRQGKEVLAKFGDIQLPGEAWEFFPVEGRPS